jgi:hypothetical protein
VGNPYDLSLMVAALKHRSIKEALETPDILPKEVDIFSASEMDALT